MTATGLPRAMAAIAAPLDVVRARVLARTGRPGRMLLRQRSARIATYGATGIVTALALAVLTPLWAFALGPVVFGVPHLVADVRYLVVGPGLHRRSALAWSVGIPLLAATVSGSAAVGLSAGFGPLLFARRGTTRVRALLVAAWLGVVLYAAHRPALTVLVLVHGHNVLALVLFVTVFARSRRVALLLVLATTAASALLLSGVFDRTIAARDLGALLDAVAPMSDPVVAMRLGALFVFLQVLHYTLWLRVIPEDARMRRGIRSFRASAEALYREMGQPLLYVFGVFAVVVTAVATTSLEVARLVYLRGATFHTYLEIAFGLLVILEGRPSRS